MNDTIIFTGNYTLTSRDADVYHKLRISSLINLYIQAAWEHAEILGLGVSHLYEHNMGWVLSRFTVRINSLPTWPGSISVKSWPKGMNRLFYIRDAEIYNDKEEIQATITSGWLIVDTNTKRPKIYNTDNDVLYINKDKHAIENEIPTLKFPTDIKYSEDYKIKFNDIDMNQHLTTVRYVELIIDTYDLDFLMRNPIIEISVNFIKEIKFGTEIRIDRTEDQNIHQFEIVDKVSDNVCFRSEIKFQKP